MIFAVLERIPIVLVIRVPLPLSAQLGTLEFIAGLWNDGRAPTSLGRFRMDQDGLLYFVGRSDDIIKTRGEKVSPVEVENVLHGMPGIREAAVVGVPDAILGQAIRAYVALEPGVSLSEKEIVRYCLARLENFMAPKEVVFLPELPKTNTGKISKKTLVEVASP